MNAKDKSEAERRIFELVHTVRWYDDGCICQDCGATGTLRPGENTQSNPEPFFGDIFTEECIAVLDESEFYRV